MTDFVTVILFVTAFVTGCVADFVPGFETCEGFVTGFVTCFVAGFEINCVTSLTVC